MDTLIASMNDILDQWKNEHDHFSAIASIFHCDRGHICFDRFVVCQDSPDLQLTSAQFDAYGIQFFLNRNTSILISFTWPEDLPPKVSSIAYIQFLENPEPFYLDEPALEP